MIIISTSLFLVSLVFASQVMFGSAHEDEAPRLVRILSIDGGGVRGVIPLTILSEIERRTGKPISESFDVITGTSTGGVIALSLSAPADDGTGPRYTADELLALYTTRGEEIFGSKHKNYFSFGGLLRPRYSSKGLESLSVELLGSTALSSSLVPVAVTAFDIRHDAPIVFESQRAKLDPGENFLMKDVAIGTSSAPTYFPPKRMESFYGQECCVVDGGVVQNNPSLVGYSLAKEIYPRAQDVLLVSLGTGKISAPLDDERMKDAGATTWIKPIVTMGINGVASLVDDQMRRLVSSSSSGSIIGVSERYFRLQPDIPEKLGALDKTTPEHVAALLEVARGFVNENQEKIESLAGILSRPIHSTPIASVHA
ncbi:MAG: patatin-like phospholipase family protein [Proteobacteria bacterium]|nr:patatin-like phospholipase family protein [Pseudomonadota bacterium]